MGKSALFALYSINKRRFIIFCLYSLGRSERKTYYVPGRVILNNQRPLFQGQKIVKFTHPIFESDFDCLTGNDRFHALLSPSPLASYIPNQITNSSRAPPTFIKSIDSKLDYSYNFLVRHILIVFSSSLRQYENVESCLKQTKNS